MISPNVTLAFDPEKSDDPFIRDVFKSVEGRSLWIAIRRDHIVSQHFNMDILSVASKIMRKMPKTGRELGLVLAGNCTDEAASHPWDIWGGCSWRKDIKAIESDKRKREAILDELLLYVRGEKHWNITIK